MCSREACAVTEALLRGETHAPGHLGKCPVDILLDVERDVVWQRLALRTWICTVGLQRCAAISGPTAQGAGSKRCGRLDMTVASRAYLCIHGGI